MRYRLPTPKGTFIEPPKNGWRWELATLIAKVDSGEIRFNDDMTAIRRRTYLADAKGLPPSTFWSELEETGHNRQAKIEQKQLFGEDDSKWFSTPKPERLIQKVLALATNPGDLVLDSFLGSGTTAAVAHKMGRRWIGIEMGAHARTHCLPKLEKVIAGERGGISEAVNWTGGGGFRFLELGAEMFDAEGRIQPGVRFADLGAYVWMRATRLAATRSFDGPRLGEHDGTAYYLLYNGVLGDRRPAGGNVLNGAVLDLIEKQWPGDGTRIVYGESCRLGPARLAAARVTFRQLPYDVSAF